ncbi:MAG: hypothetical protein HY690_11820 [Chloroflexi bacterium]|nr:hypothetical protein [Chloroflexota bacterium]
MEGRAAVWTLVGIVVCFKLGTALVILLNAHPAGDALGLLIATNWLLVVIVVLLVAGPALFWFRLVRVRARRRRLERGEWEV